MDIKLEEKDGVRLAIEGCGHGTLHAIYASVAEACKQKDWPGVDLLIIGGDFQAVRNAYDLHCVSMPAKYREMCDFHEYYSGKRKAPYLTVFVGGNHEASNYLFELYYGGWVAPQIYYLGAANVLRLGPLRIAGMSGIWKGYNYRRPHFERLPYNSSEMRSVYSVRELDVRKLLQIRTPVDIGISHDWPKGVEWKGDWKQLFRFKPHFESDAKSGQLGSVAAQKVMDWIRPRYWFSAHLHAKYAALVDFKGEKPALSENSTAVHVENKDQIELDNDDLDIDEVATSTKNQDEIDLDLDDDAELKSGTTQSDGAAPAKNADEIDLDLDDDTGPALQTSQSQQSIGQNAAPTLSAEAARAALPEAFRRPQPQAAEPIERPSGISNKTTQFLALDKCLPGRHFLQILSIPVETSIESQRPLKLTYDREWLAITRSFAINEPLVLGDPDAVVPREQAQGIYRTQIEQQEAMLTETLGDRDLTVPENFENVAPVYDGGNWNSPQYSQVIEHPNPQTAKYCEMLKIPNPFDISEQERSQRLAAGPKADPYEEKFGDGGKSRGGFSHGGGRGRGRGQRGRGFGRGGRRGR